MQLSLWLYAISVGIGSAREIARRTQSDDAFRWLVGDKEVGHATLSAFRVGHGTALEKLMTDVLGVLLHKRLVSLDRVAQDGTRVRASASAPSFRREAALLDCREQAALHVKGVLADPDPEATEAKGWRDLERRSTIKSAWKLPSRRFRRFVTKGKKSPVRRPRTLTLDG